MAATKPAPAAAPQTPAAPAEMARLEVALSALVRWSESKHIRAEVARMSGCDVPSSALRLLEHFDASGEMRVSDVADCLRIDISTVSLQLRQLKAESLVSRRRDPADGRSGVVGITDHGREVLRKVRAARCELLAEAFTEVSAEELGQAAGILGKVQEHMLADQP